MPFDPGVLTVFAVKRRSGSSRVMQNAGLNAEPVSLRELLSVVRLRKNDSLPELIPALERALERDLLLYAVV